MSGPSTPAAPGAPEVIVIGAGVIGVSIGLALRTAGASVTIIERDEGLGAASSMNAGGFAFSEIQPLAAPGIMLKAPIWLLDPLGPLSIPPAYAPRIAPWLLRFWRASWRDQYAGSLRAQAALMTLARAALERQVAAVDGEALIRREGQLQLYEGAAQFEASQTLWRARESHGVRFELLNSPEAIADIQPGLSPRFTHAGFTPDWINAVDPAKWLARLAHAFLERGGRIDRAAATGLAHEGDLVRVSAPQGDRWAEQVVVAAGAWSHLLARPLGDAPPLETERGYNTTLPDGAFDLRTQLTFPEHGFVVTRVNGGVRVGGAVELGGLKLPPNYKRADRLLAKAAAFLPALRTEGGEQWMGFRPSTPDTLPVIGRSPKAERVIYAFGHGHLGLTQSAATAELVRDLVLRRAPAIDLSPYRPQRF